MRAKEVQADLAYIPHRNSSPQSNNNAFLNTANVLLIAQNIFGEQTTYINNNNNSTSSAKSVPVLAYHGIPTESENSVPLSVFIDQMNTLKNAGWKTINIDQLNKFLKGEIQLPEKSFVLTFDDGRKDTYYPVDPVLKDLGFHAVMFVITDKSLPYKKNKNSTYYLSEVELKSMQDSGRWDLESHGGIDHYWYQIDEKGNTGHFLSNKLWLKNENRFETEDEFKNRTTTDLSNSKNSLEGSFGKQVLGFAYPFSDYGEDTINFPGSEKIIYDEIGALYPLTFYQSRASDGDTFNYPSNSFMVKRTEPAANWSGEKLLQTFTKGQAKKLPYISTSFGSEWVTTWGNSTSTNDGLEITPSANSTGADIFLNGSYLWNNYSFNIDVNSNASSSVSLITRRTNNNKYISCVFSSNRISIKEQSKDSSLIVSDLISDKQILTNNSGNIGMSVKNSVAECLVNGKVMLTNKDISQSYSNGGVGIQVWNPNQSEAYALVTNMEVTPE